MKDKLLHELTRENSDVIKFATSIKDTFKKRQEAMIQRFDIHDTTITLVNAHLTSGKELFSARADDVKKIFEEAFQKDKFGKVQDDIIHKSDQIYIFGSLNFRLKAKDNFVRQLTQNMDNRVDSNWSEDELKRIQDLLVTDEFLTQKSDDWYLRDFEEAPIAFGPTCKFDTKTQRFNSDSKHAPSWYFRFIEGLTAYCTLVEAKSSL